MITRSESLPKPRRVAHCTSQAPITETFIARFTFCRAQPQRVAMCRNSPTCAFATRCTTQQRPQTPL